MSKLYNFLVYPCFFMIDISKDYILFEGEIKGEAINFLWDSLEVVGRRFVGVIINFNKKKIDFPDYELTKKGNVGIGLFKIKNKDDFKKFMNLSQDSITDYYIVIIHYIRSTTKDIMHPK